MIQAAPAYPRPSVHAAGAGGYRHSVRQPARPAADGSRRDRRRDRRNGARPTCHAGCTHAGYVEPARPAADSCVEATIPPVCKAQAALSPPDATEPASNAHGSWAQTPWSSSTPQCPPEQWRDSSWRLACRHVATGLPSRSDSGSRCKRDRIRLRPGRAECR
jgi:hypothetical protein